MKTFNQGGKDDLIAKLEYHAAADAFTQGLYFEEGRGCAVGCSLVGYDGVCPDDHSAYERLFGIPEDIAYLEDQIFERLSVEDSKKWPLRFTHAIPVETDITGVIAEFVQFILTDETYGVINATKSDATKKIIQDISDLYLSWPEVDVERALALRQDAKGTYYTTHYDYSYDKAVSSAVSSASYCVAGYVSVASIVEDASYAVSNSNFILQEYYKVIADKLIDIIEKQE